MDNYRMLLGKRGKTLNPVDEGKMTPFIDLCIGMYMCEDELREVGWGKKKLIQSKDGGTVSM